MKNTYSIGIGILTTVVAVIMSDNEVVRNYMHSNAFIVGHEAMEVMVECPFDDAAMCERYQAECINRIEQGGQINAEEIADCARVVEEAVQEICGAMGSDCETLK